MDEWNIPYDEVRIVEKVGRGPMGEVFRGYWHGEVAIKRFCLDNATPEHLIKLREEVRGESVTIVFIVLFISVVVQESVQRFQ